MTQLVLHRFQQVAFEDADAVYAQSLHQVRAKRSLGLRDRTATIPMCRASGPIPLPLHGPVDMRSKAFDGASWHSF